MLVDLVEISSNADSNGLVAKANIVLTVESQFGYADKFDCEVAEIKERIVAIFSGDEDTISDSSVSKESLTDIIASLKTVEEIRVVLKQHQFAISSLPNVTDDDKKIDEEEYWTKQIGWLIKIQNLLMEKVARCLDIE